ncbi:class I SAM-dependent methyltransferase [Streptomyces sp. NPDC057499]|uniref:class I SAM-dependent methyltransferase n=1 Tax=Streptomyces sp. NPDC057499 TaxID=3346150 RepID=UPI0036C66EFD
MSPRTRAHGTVRTGANSAYWEPLWRSGRRYRSIDVPEREALYRQAGVGGGRPALDIGSGDGALVRALTDLGYRATGIDCAPGALSAARHEHPGLDFRHFDFGTDDPAGLPEPAFALITCRLVYPWVQDKPGFLARVRRLLAPGGVFWVATSVHRPRSGSAARPWEVGAAEVELLAGTWSRADVTQLDESYHCFALHPGGPPSM